jgi:subtilisin family serine protease
MELNPAESRDTVPSTMGKLQPKLRMVANGSTEVNAIRAEHAAALRVSEEIAAQFPPVRAESDAPVELEDLSDIDLDWQEPESPGAQVSVFLRLSAEAAGHVPPDINGVTASRANLLTAELPIEDATAMRDHGLVSSVEMGQPLVTPDPAVMSDSPDEPSDDFRRFGDEERHHFGQGVLVGIIDVGGFDFAHPDFHDGKGGTRFVRIWDQGGDAHPSPRTRGTSPFDYGAEVRQDELSRAMAEEASGGLPAVVLERQSQMDQGSHGTHVASIAAGNLGVCRAAWIAGVLISVPEDDADRRRSFYDSTRVAHAVDYLLAVAEELKQEHGLSEVPVSINVSLGTNGHAHDDSAPVTRWIDLALTQPGRSVCVAAGNAGQERAEGEDDIGWVMGRVHASGRIPARQLAVDIEWNVVGNGVLDLSENELEIWYGAEDRLAVQVRPPAQPWSEPIGPGQFIENRRLPDGSFLSVYNEIYHPANGDNYIALYLSPQLREPAVVGVRAGQWLVRLIGSDVRDGTYHAWIERDDPRKLGRLGPRDAWQFPSFFSERSMVDHSTISSLACGSRVVAVANLDEPGRRISITSSQGPTRDGRHKPDVAAPGSAIVAANGFANGDLWITMSGTSMASPFVAGVVGLMLASNPHLTGAQIAGILRRTAQPLPGADFAWRNDAGAGEINPEACILEATAMRTSEDIT